MKFSSVSRFCRLSYLFLIIGLIVMGCGDDTDNENTAGASAVGGSGGVSGSDMGGEAGSTEGGNAGAADNPPVAGMNAGGDGAAGMAGEGGDSNISGTGGAPETPFVEPSTLFGLLGSYTDQFAATKLSINSLAIVTDGGAYEGVEYVSGYQLEMIGTDGTYAVGRDLKDNSYSLFEFIVEAGTATHYCQSVFSAMSIDDVFDVPGADSANLDAGCNTFPWSTLSKVDFGVAIDGADATNNRLTVTESYTKVASPEYRPALIHHARLVSGDEAGTYTLIGLNDTGNDFGGEKWSRFDMVIDGQTVKYCQIAFDAADFSSALATPAADASDSAEGCNGFPWSSITNEIVNDNNGGANSGAGGTENVGGSGGNAGMGGSGGNAGMANADDECGTVHQVTSTNGSLDFTPEDITISAGDCVDFVMSNAHNAIEVSQETYENRGSTALLDGFQVDLGETKRIKFDSPGMHYYICTPHVNLGMVGTITVE